MRVLLAFFLLTLSACGSRAEDAPAPRSSCGERQFDGSRFTVCDPGGGKIILVAASRLEPPVRSFAELMRKVDPARVAFAMNAGMFDEEGRPIGMAVVDQREVRRINRREGGGNFHLMPNGVFMVTCGGRPAIFRSDRIPQFRCAPQLSTQSGPMLVIDGKLHPRFEHDGTSRLIRNGVGVTADGRALFVISEDPVSFGKFARFFRDALHTPNALFFDGSVSSLWDPANGRQDSHAPLGPIIVVLKPEASAPGRAGRAKP